MKQKIEIAISVCKILATCAELFLIGIIAYAIIMDIPLVISFSIK